MSENKAPEKAHDKKGQFVPDDKDTVETNESLVNAVKKARAKSNDGQLNFRLLKFPADVSGRLTLLKSACVSMGTIVKHDRAMDMVEALHTMADWVERKSRDNLRSRQDRADASLKALTVKRAADAENARQAAVKDAETKISAAKAAKAYVADATKAADVAKANVSK